jgi:hypothetical protein
MMNSEIRSLVEKYADETAAIFRTRLRTSLGLNGTRTALVDIGKALKHTGAVFKDAAFELTSKPRKKAPIQLCPVPKCGWRAAPVFGMVCAKHKHVSKGIIQKYREARRKAKAA